MKTASPARESLYTLGRILPALAFLAAAGLAAVPVPPWGWVALRLFLQF